MEIEKARARYITIFRDATLNCQDYPQWLAMKKRLEEELKYRIEDIQSTLGKTWADWIWRCKTIGTRDCGEKWLNWNSLKRTHSININGKIRIRGGRLISSYRNEPNESDHELLAIVIVFIVNLHLLIASNDVT